MTYDGTRLKIKDYRFYSRVAKFWIRTTGGAVEEQLRSCIPNGPRGGLRPFIVVIETKN